MAEHNVTGHWGEQVACDTLVAAGYAIVERNWRSGHYEIDIVAMKGQYIVFVEVKTREDDFVDPVDSIDAKKITRICRAADVYIRANDIPHEAQFDIITIVGTPDNYHVEHIPDAFLPPLKTYR
ncbi:MAG: YraN family protein [Muribaculaceae bacterium]|nr:YraN family protein [Muribaculaceae bacterium]MBR4721918.1 YraN family protein [Muribaculaceae bacterium]MBR5744908.1 YraN family protein [Muribaculaceae bacterium]